MEKTFLALNLTISAENVKPVHPLYKFIRFWHRPCRTDFVHILTQDAEINSEQSRKVSNPYNKLFRRSN